MKKTLVLLTILLLLTLSGCSDDPFEPRVDGYTLKTTDTINFTHHNGIEDRLLFSYTFSKEYFIFVNEEGTIINFNNINNYKDLTSDLKTFFSEYTGEIAIDKTEGNYRLTQELSLGATENNYNYEEVEIEEAYNVNAFVHVGNGVVLLLSYTEFLIEGETYYIPSFIQFLVGEIYTDIEHTYYSSNNEFSEDQGRLMKFQSIIVPLPYKTGYNSNFEDQLQESDERIDKHTIFDSVISSKTGTKTPCEDTITDSCFTPIFTELEVQIYNMTLEDVYEFYFDHYNATYDGNTFVFIEDGYAYTFSTVEEVEVRLANNEIVPVVNATIIVYTE